MVNGQLDVVVRHLHRLAGTPGGAEPSDGQLLERFAGRGEEAAFAALVRRHGPMVLGVCRRLLGQAPDADDAFQATFLVLFRRARALHRAGSLAGYLYTVAYHVALKAKANAARRQRREKEVRDMPRAERRAEDLWDDLQPVLDEELNRLPDHYRAAVVVCYLQGRTNEEASRVLGCPAGTVKSRLARARALLRTRLARRGLALAAAPLAAILAERAGASVPPALAQAAVRATVLAAAGQALAPAVTALADGVLKALFVARIKVAGALLLALGSILLAAAAWTHQARAQGPAEEPTRDAPPIAQKEPPKPEPKEPAKPDSQTMTVSGRVLDADGKPLTGARVAVCGRQLLLLSSMGWAAAFRNELLGQTKSDKDGNYRLTVPRTDTQMTYRTVRVVASAADHGLTWKALNADADEVNTELRLPAVRRVSGHIVGLQGEDAAGLTIHVARVTRTPDKGEREEDAAFRPPDGLPLGATTDAKGNFALDGFGPGVKLELELRDPRYERKDDWVIDTSDPKQCENVRVVLAPGRYVEGRVTYQDSGKPVPHARLMLANPVIETRADAEGRFKVPLYTPRDDPFAGYPRDIAINAYPPPGEPYLAAAQGVDFPRGVVKREVNLALPRGVLLRGKITEAGSGKAVAGAYVSHDSRFDHCPVSAPDGSYQIGVAPGGVRLVVAHPSGEYIAQIVGSGGGGANNPNGGSATKPVGNPSYYHAVIDIDVKKDEKEKEVNISLRRGVTVKGRLVGPDDKSIPSAVLFVGNHHRPRFENIMHPVHVRDGQFEVRGCDPDKTYRLLFLEHPRLPTALMTVEAIEGFGQLWLRELLGPENKLGASVEVTPNKVKDDLIVKLAPCGTAKVRFVDGDGKPLTGYYPWLQLVVTPGPRIYQALQDKTLAAEVVTLTGRYGSAVHNDLATDDKGYVTFAGLIPGATYRLKKVRQEPNNEVIKEFTAEAGKTLELEVVVK
jgi:RNA polymerase sigma factor (sigma-70 family)